MSSNDEIENMKSDLTSLLIRKQLQKAKLIELEEHKKQLDVEIIFLQSSIEDSNMQIRSLEVKIGKAILENENSKDTLVTE